MLRGLVLLSFLSLSSLWGQNAPKSCVIVRHHQHRFGENTWKMHKPFDYVEGEFPSGIKFVAELGDKQIESIHDKGGKVVILQAGYQLPDLQDARDQCKAFIVGMPQTSPASAQAPVQASTAAPR